MRPVQWWVYLISALLCLLGALPRISFSGDRSRLLSPGHPVQQRFEQVRQQFGDFPELVVLVHGGDGVDRQAAADWWADRLRETPGVQCAFSRVDTPLWPQQGLYFLPVSELRKLALRLRSQRGAVEALARRQWLALGRSGGDPDVRQAFERALRSHGREPYRSPWGEMPPEIPASVPLTLNADTQVVVSVWQRELDLGQIRAWEAEADRRFPRVQSTPAGAALAQADDARRALGTALQVTLIAVLCVHLYFRWMFGEPRSARLALVSVAVALAWTCLWVSWAAPRLNLITINFAATLLGLGMDFHIQLLYRRRSLDGLDEALRESRSESLTGALAVSLAFASLTLLPYVAVAQLGKITSVGVLLCWLASRTVFPALLRRFPPALPAPTGSLPLGLERWCEEHRGVVLGVALLVSALALLAAPRVGFDGNLLHMLSPHSESLRMERAFHSQAGHCGLYAVSVVADEAALRERVTAFGKLPQVARVESLAVWKPALQPGHREAVAEVLRAYRALPQLGTKPLVDSAEMERMRDMGASVGDDMGPGPMQDVLNSFLGGLHDDVAARLHWLSAQRLEPMPGWEQLTAAWRQIYQRPGAYLIRIYGRAELWEPAELERFLAALRSVDPQVTGLPTVVGAFLGDLRNAYWEAGRNALLAISVLLLVHFRSLKLALWGLTPKLLAMLWMLGAMGWLGVQFNPANVTALPLTLGIGLMFGIQVVHGTRHPGGLFARGVGLPILVSGVSTILGYAALCSADYPGVVSLGLVMALGVGCNLLVALLVMPALLRGR